MPAQIKGPNKIPEWLAVLPKNARLNSREFAEALGLKYHTFTSRVSEDLCGMPRPDFKFEPKNFGRRRFLSNNQWKAVTVRNYIRKLNRESQND